jgi:hypothetical protein
MSHIVRIPLQFQFIYYINDYIMKQYPRFRGPSLILLAVVHILIFVAGLVAVATLRRGALYVNPYAPAETIRAFLAQNPAAVRIGNFLLFGSAVPLGIFAVTVVSRLRYLGIRAAGTNIALLGGFIATFALIFSGLSGWVLSLPDVTASAPVAKGISFLSFLFGGAAYAIGFGLLAAGVSVTSFFARTLPRWLVVLGMLVAITGELSWLSLVAYPANFFIPVTRYVGFIWMLLAAVRLTRSRPGSMPLAAQAA